MPKILLINSSPEKNYLLAQAFKELAQKKFSFSLWSAENPMLEQFKNWPAKKIFLGPDLKNNLNVWLFAAILFFLQFKFLTALSALKFRRRVDIIVCLNFNEKIIITLPARLLGLKVVWFDGPELNYRQLNFLTAGLYKLNAGLAKIIVFNNFTELQLKNLGCDENKIILLSPGAKPLAFQENIFNKLAGAGRDNFRRKYFTVGVITALNQKQKIEVIFQAVKICLPLIANLQLIIIGEGGERKTLIWLAKKMEIENLVWLVGEQKQLKKWLNNFDVFLATGSVLALDDYSNIIEAMTAGLPVLAPRYIGLEDLVIENKTGALYEVDNSEMLARQIIKLHQDKRLLRQLGQNGQNHAGRLFTFDKMVGEMEKIFI